MNADDVVLPIFTKIVNILDLHIKGQDLNSFKFKYIQYDI